MFEYNGSYEKLKNACWSDLWLHGTWYYIYRTQVIASVEVRKSPEYPAATQRLLPKATERIPLETSKFDVRVVHVVPSVDVMSSD